MEFDRRELVIAGAAGGVAAALGALPASAQGAASPRRFKKAVMLGMVQHHGPLLERFRLLRDCGFDGVEVDSPSDLRTEELLAAKQATGLEVEGTVDSAHWSKPLSDPDPRVRDEGRAALLRSIEDCAAWGGTSVLLVPAVVNEHVAYDEAWERSSAEIKQVLAAAERARVKIAIENVWNNFLLSPLEAARYVDQFQSPWVGWHFDVGNVITYGWPEQWIRILGARILKLHIKEYSRKKRDELGRWKGFEVELGEGDNRWPEVVKALREIGYDGWATAEVGGGEKERLLDISRRMDAILA
ncbi:MAG: sugar phosphate isomerase/epimerase [Planctomycetes bacterium]|nr:sugar phosphate isomerase/epimerase [Planctomycetota bacterium]